MAFHNGEVPVGCVIVRNGEIVARGQNKPNQTKDVSQFGGTESAVDLIAVLGLVSGDHARRICGH